VGVDVGTSSFTRRREAAIASIQIQPILVDRDTAAGMLMGIAPSTFQKYLQQGLIPKPRMLGNRAGWLVSELQAAAQQLPISDLLPPPPTPRMDGPQRAAAASHTRSNLTSHSRRSAS
jgi:predicted DNA-binding transcriptional regulator AlpA